MPSYLSPPRPFLLQPIVFLTAVTHDRRDQLANARAFDTLTSIWRHSSDFDGWFVGDYILMPDHVHLFARAAVDAKPLAGWTQTWKSISARRLGPGSGLEPFWQRDCFNRFLRSAENYSLEWDYVSMNPVRQSLCDSPDDWPWKGQLFNLTF